MRSSIKSGVILLFFITFLSGCTALKLAKQIKMIKQQAEQYAQAIKNGDYAALMEMTYPAVVTEMGGEFEAKDKLEAYVGNLMSGGMKLDKITTGEPSEVVKAGSELHAIISQTVSLKVPGGFLDTKINLLAVSDNKGKSWKFIDTSRYKADKMVPNFNSSLKIPQVERPKFRKNN